ncbi:hypothetical protein [Pseudoalteromonas lipolytica]|uniref:Glycosyl transferases group 1 n=1 Tax=Pseudoalteromonas lipolytica TaxID=570156 RepID=A0A0P7END7_9GAMM|nr:hypothetical protein [Pseudoalteromonas lipolytica]KPM84274.1 hypothetical protein AOG27_08220 [Pseudoalteromonas lipolytica]
MSKNLLVTRESIENHPILRVLEQQNSTLRSLNVKERPLNILKVLTWKGDFLVSDPIVALLCFWRTFTFYSLEMFEFQVANVGIRNKVRNFTFKVSHFIALKRAQKVVFPNEIRKEYYVDKYNLKNEVNIYPNYPSEKTLKILKQIHCDVNNSGLKLGSFLESLGFEHVPQNIENKEVFVYIGTVNSGNRGIESILAGIKKRKNAFLILAGPQKEKIFESGEIGSYYMYVGKLEHQLALKLLFLANVGVLYYSKNLKNTDYCAPVKIFEYINAGLEIISNRCYGLVEYAGAIKFYLEDDGEIEMNPLYDCEFIEKIKNVSFESNFDS